MNPDESHVGSSLLNGGGNGSFLSLSTLISVWNLGANDVSDVLDIVRIVAGVGRVDTLLAFCKQK